jgi:hypothetical protein
MIGSARRTASAIVVLGVTMPGRLTLPAPIENALFSMVA